MKKYKLLILCYLILYGCNSLTKVKPVDYLNDKPLKEWPNKNEWKGTYFFEAINYEGNIEFLDSIACDFIIRQEINNIDTINRWSIWFAQRGFFGGLEFDGEGNKNRLAIYSWERDKPKHLQRIRGTKKEAMIVCFD